MAHVHLFLNFGTSISDKTDFFYGFNNFFVNIEPNLANNIIPPSGDE